MDGKILLCVAFVSVPLILQGCGGGGKSTCTITVFGEDLSGPAGICVVAGIDQLSGDCCELVQSSMPKNFAPHNVPTQDEVCSKCQGSGTQEMQDKLKKMCSNSSQKSFVFPPLETIFTLTKNLQAKPNLQDSLRLSNLAMDVAPSNAWAKVPVPAPALKVSVGSDTCTDSAGAGDCLGTFTKDGTTLTYGLKSVAKGCCDSIKTVGEDLISIIGSGAPPPVKDIAAMCTACKDVENVALKAAIQELERQKFCNATTVKAQVKVDAVTV